jgi:hypothetical protein
MPEKSGKQKLSGPESKGFQKNSQGRTKSIPEFARSFSKTLSTDLAVCMEIAWRLKFITKWEGKVMRISGPRKTGFLCL